MQEALFLASPALYTVFERWQKGLLTDPKEISKIEITIAKYLLRMGYRSTPFGLFAGISYGNFSKTTRVELTEPAGSCKHVRLDMDYLCALALELAHNPAIRLHLTYRPNTTLYKTSDSLRLVEYRIANRSRTHHLVNLDAGEYLNKALVAAEQGATINAIAKQLVDEEVTLDDALDFVHELLNSQVLTSKLEPCVTGKDYLSNIIEVLMPIAACTDLVGQLQRLQDTLLGLNTLSATDAVQAYKDIELLLKPLGIPYDFGQLFQVDLRKPTAFCSLNEDITEELQLAVRFLLQVARPETNQNLRRFREAFQSRYKGQEVDLMVALDAETGLGYPFEEGVSRDNTPLLNDLMIDASLSTTKEFHWSAWHKLLLDAYLEAVRNDQGVLRIDELDLSKIPHQPITPDAFPHSFYSMVSILASSAQAVEDGEYALLYHGTGGPSAANYLGRFCYLDERLSNDVKECLVQEANHYPETILAEIVHINQARAGNIIIRPCLRDYEIPILVQSGVDDAHTLPLHDLRLSSRAGRLVLRSRKLDKEVLPRMSSAHNHLVNTLPSYHFLCDLQQQDAPVDAQWNWGPMGEANFLPRVEFGKVILCRAQWTLTASELNLFKNAEPEVAVRTMQALRKKRNMPKWMSLRESDNELPLDLDNILSMRVFQSVVKLKNRVILQECLLTNTESFVQGQGQAFNNEFVIPLQFRAETPRLPRPQLKKAALSGPSRHFGIGSEWAYFKIYSGVKTADLVLAECIKPLADALLGDGLIDQWFFIRYADPEHHLRVRFHGHGNFYAPLIERIHAVLQPLAATLQISGYTTDVYKRELERYGPQTMEVSELIFWRDSEAVARIISLLDPGEAGDELRWLIGMRGTDALLQDFNLTLDDKIALLEKLQERSKHEFHMTSALSKKSLGNRYRRERTRIEGFMKEVPDVEAELLPVFAALAERRLSWKSAIGEIVRKHREGQLEVNYTELIESYVHMFLNRLFRSKQRIQEMVLYDFLYQFYTSAAAKERRGHGNNKPVRALQTP